MSPTQLLARLRWLLDDARALGLSDVDLAQAGVSHALLAAAASGDLGPWTTHAASQLARRLGYDDSVLWREEGIPGQHLRGYRGPAKVLVASDEILMRGIQSVLEALALRAAPSRRSAARRSTRRPPWWQGYALARWARRFGHEERAPIRDLTAWVEETFLLPVLKASLRTPQIEGVTVLGPRGVALVLDAEAAGVLGRRTLAHELCHALFDPLPDGPTWQPEVADDATGAEALLEQRARAFAAELLIPLAGLRTLELPSEPEARVEFVAERFGAPTELTRFHLVNHGLLAADAKLGAVDASASRASWKLESGRLLWRSLEQRVEVGEMSPGRARELARLLEGVDGARGLLAA
jgi:Zn-dependent peptidase ImmA (M78 family)